MLNLCKCLLVIFIKTSVKHAYISIFILGKTYVTHSVETSQFFCHPDFTWNQLYQNQHICEKNLPNLISRKIWKSEKFLNFPHCVKPTHIMRLSEVKMANYVSEKKNYEWNKQLTFFLQQSCLCFDVILAQKHLHAN